MSLSRILKLFAAQNAGQVVTIITQLLLPPVFLHAYGVALYGEWIALSAAIGYLGTFNYGLQTYTNMQMTIHYNRGELLECRQIQSAGLRVLIGTFLIFALLLSGIFILPLDRLLHLTIPQGTAQLALYLLGLQIVAGMLFGFFKGSYMVVGAAHRGENFNNLWQLVLTLGTVAIAIFHVSFAMLAAMQLLVTLLAALLMIADLWRVAPDIRPTIRYWEPGSLGTILRPSGYYALLYSSNILAYQLPVILMQRILGPAAVVIFSVSRTIYSMSRRLPYLVTNAIGPEVTITFGQRDWKRLVRLYELSERVVLLLVPPTTFGAMLFTPLLLTLWLHRGNLYYPYVSLLLGLTIAIQSIKEHKYQFQFSSNQIREMSYMTPLTYGIMLLLSIPAMHRFGLVGFLCVWPACELVQLLYLLHLNRQLFKDQAVLDMRPVYILCLVLFVGSLALAWPLLHIAQYPIWLQGISATVLTLIVAALSYWIFQVDEVRDILWRRMATRFPSLAQRFS
jgi:O-antigen/teichoic acid export membrane protein